MAFAKSQPKPEHLIATLHVPGMPGVSYAVIGDNPHRLNDETGGFTDESVCTEGELRRLTLARMAAGLAAVFGMQVSPEELEPEVEFLKYDQRLFPTVREPDSLLA
jgi:hypothetical protein